MTVAAGQGYVFRLLRRPGAAEDVAGEVARDPVGSDLSGRESHGVIRLFP